MDDIKSAFGLGGGTGSAITNIKNDLLSLATLIENTLIPKIDKMASSLGAVAKSFGSVIESSKSSNLLIADKHGRVVGESGGGSSGGGNRVAPAPVFSPGFGPGGGSTPGKWSQPELPFGDSPYKEQPPAPAGGSNNRVAAGMTGASVLAGANYAATAMSAALPSTTTSVLQDYMTVRSGFYGIGGGGSQQDQSGRIHALQKQLANQGTMTDSMDSTKAIYAGQKLGLTGYSNFSTGKNSIIAGAASISNLEPGLGGEGAMQAQAAVAKPQTVNMLRTIGINMVGANGKLTTTAQMIDQIWDYLMRTDGPKALTEAAIQFESTPGHGLYVMLSNLFQGNNDMIQIVVDGLIMKSKLKGASVANLTRSQMQKAGGTSATVNKIAAKTAAQNDLLVDTAANTSAGYGASADLAKAMNRFADIAPGLVGALGGINGFLTGFKAIGGGILGNMLSLYTASKLLKGVEGAGGIGGFAKKAGKGAIGLLKGVGGLFKKSFGILKNTIGKTFKAAGNLGGDLAEGSWEQAALDFGEVGLGAAEVVGEGAAIAAYAGGGPANGRSPYLVGEKGPELFVPKVDGVVVPAGLTSKLGRASGGPVKSGGAPTTGADLTKYLMSQGYTQAGAEGIVGNLTWESGLNTKIVGDKGTSFGLAQWHAGRWDNLKKFAASKNLDPGSATAQEQFLASELNAKGYSGLKKELQDPRTSKVQAAGDFMREFERPQNTSESMAIKRANAYKGKLGLTAIGSDGGSSGSGPTQSAPTMADLNLQAQAGAQAAWNAIGGGTTGQSNNHNYGGVTINVSAGNYSHDALVKMFSDLFTNKGISAKISG
jgi:Phage tail lysozyme